MNGKDRDRTTFKVKLLGVRGSVPVSGQEFRKYGGSSTCIMITYGDRKIFVDGGSGILSSGDPGSDVAVLLTHGHVDHLNGLPLWKPVFGDEHIDIYSVVRDGRTGRDLVDSLMKKPLWPVDSSAFTNVDFRDIDMSAPDENGIVRDILDLGGLAVDAMPGDHPGGVTCFRFRDKADGARTVCVCTDCEVTDANIDRYAEFVRGADLLLADGQYEEAEYAAKTGWGHSTVGMAAKLGARGRVGRTVIIHHDIDRTDGDLERLVETEAPGAEPGAQGTEYEL